MYECFICKEEREDKDKIILSCSRIHVLCKLCFTEIKKRSDKCPFCRATFALEDPDPEEWLYLDPSEWVVYSKTEMVHGSEKIYVYKRNETQPSWRKNELVIEMKRTRQRNKKIRNK